MKISDHRYNHLLFAFYIYNVHRYQKLQDIFLVHNVHFGYLCDKEASLPDIL